MAIPRSFDNISELAGILKTRYPDRKNDQLGKKYDKGHRTHTILAGHRPATRSHKRAMRPR
jgi:hypothetical protein